MKGKRGFSKQFWSGKKFKEIKEYKLVCHNTLASEQALPFLAQNLSSAIQKILHRHYIYNNILLYIHININVWIWPRTNKKHHTSVLGASHYIDCVTPTGTHRRPPSYTHTAKNVSQPSAMLRNSQVASSRREIPEITCFIVLFLFCKMSLASLLSPVDTQWWSRTTNNYKELSRTLDKHREPQKTTNNHPEPQQKIPINTKNHQEPQRLTKNHQELPRTTKNNQEPARITTNHQEPPQSIKNVQESPRTTMNHQELLRTTKKHQETPNTKRTNKNQNEPPKTPRTTMNH